MASLNLDQRTACNITTAVSYLQQQLDILQHENQQLKQSISDQNEQYQSDHDYLELRIKSIIQENDSLYATQERLESDLYAKEQDLDTVSKESQHWKRLHKELNKALELEREEFDKDRSSWLHRESQLTDTIRLLQQQRQQKDQQPHLPHSSSSFKKRNGLLPANSAPCIPTFMEKFDDILAGDGFQQRVARFDHQSGEEGETQLKTESYGPAIQSTIKAQEGIITTLRAELEQQANQLQEKQLLDNNKISTEVRNLMAEVDNIKRLNQSLMEENESYQILLHEKTISGDFISDSMTQYENDGQDNYFGHTKRQKYLSPSHTSEKLKGLNLADELALASTVPTNSTKNTVLSTEEELLAEIKTLQDANRALQLYMNKILLRIVENKHLENIFSIDEPNNGQKATTTIIKSTPPTTTIPLNNENDDQQTPMNLNQVNSRHSFSSTSTSTSTSSTEDEEGDEMSTSSSDTNSTKAIETNDGDDSWTQVFRRMSSGFTGWTRSSDPDTKSPLDYKPSSIPVDHVVRTLYCLNK